MISLHRSMHSSHMYTPGPAISFLTCFWLLPQNEHFSRSPPSPMRATQILLCLGPPQSDPVADPRRASPAPSFCRRPRRYRLGASCCGFRTAAAGAPWAAESSWLGRPYLGLALEGRQNLIYQPVLLGLFSGEELVPLHIASYLILVLAGVHGNNPLHSGAHPEDLAGLNLQVTGLTVAALHRGLVD